ncbi:unnamed protein product [Rotaria sordida]|uniref:Mitochondrial carrier protein n=1 Tax=Rotaria sordida TaxID=392033 RepID=A0A814VI21_9BILA|nr:unnamed protein product [Rotaria sordida]CAF3568121.1 unnamed protein product [Rotaria sordida]
MKDIIAGCGCGVTAAIVSHLLETLFIHLPNNSLGFNQNLLRSIRSIYKKQGLIDGFYRSNLSLPLISPAFVMSIQYLFYGQMSRHLNNYRNDNERTIEKYFLAGALTGVGSSFIETPIGLINGQIEGHLYRRHTHVFDFHVKDCCKYIYKCNGGLRGFYKGFFANLICSIPTSMFYFGGYEYMKNHLYYTHARFFYHTNKDKYLCMDILFSGAMGGFCAWSICYPLDRIRSEIQSDDLRHERRKYTSYIDCVKQMYQYENNTRIFYRGFLRVILKAIPINAACFLAYEEIYRLIE